VVLLDGAVPDLENAVRRQRPPVCTAVCRQLHQLRDVLRQRRCARGERGLAGDAEQVRRARAPGHHGVRRVDDDDGVTG